MRKLLFLLLLIPMAVQAQVGEYRTDFAVGINGGFLMNQISFTPSVPQDFMTGATGGLTLRYTCEKYFSSVCAVTAEFNWAQMGWKESILDMNDQPVYYVTDTEKTDPLRYSRRVTYLQIPVMARLGWGRERKGFQGFLQIGPQLGLYLNESTDSNLQPGVGTQTTRSSSIVAQETMPVENKFDYGITGGAGLEYSHPKIGHFLLEGRYYFGLGNIFGNTKKDYFGKSNNGAIVIKLSYLFDIVRTKNDKIK